MGISAQIGRHIAANRTNELADDLISPLLVEEGVRSPEQHSPTCRKNWSTASVSNVSCEIGESKGEGRMAEGEYIKPTPLQMLKAGVVVLGSAAGAASSIVSFILSPAIIVYVAGGICLLNSPVVVYMEKKLFSLPS